MSAPGKFEGNKSQEVAARLYAQSMEGNLDDQFGMTDEGGWYGLIGDAIVAEDSRGFFDYTLYESEQHAAEVFGEMLTTYQEQGQDGVGA